MRASTTAITATQACGTDIEEGKGAHMATYLINVFLTRRDAEDRVCIPPYARAAQRPTDDFRPTRYDAAGCAIRETYDPREWVAVPGGLRRRPDPMDDPRYVQHGLGR